MCQTSSITRSIGRNEHVSSRSLGRTAAAHFPLRRDAVIVRYQQSTRGPPPGPGAEVTCPASPFLEAAVTSGVCRESRRTAPVERTGARRPGRGAEKTRTRRAQ